MVLVRAVVHTRTATREYSSTRNQADSDTTARALLVLQAAVVKLQDYMDNGTFGKVVERYCKAATDRVLQLVKVILEGSPGTASDEVDPDGDTSKGKIYGLNPILSAAGQDAYKALRAKFEEIASKAELTYYGTADGKPWHDGLKDDASWEATLEAAKRTVLATEKDDRKEISKNVNLIVEVSGTKVCLLSRQAVPLSHHTTNK